MSFVQNIACAIRMSSKRAAIAVTIGILLGWLFKEPTNDRPSQGTVHSGLMEVKNIFDDILHHEREGIALAAYHNDEIIVDLWGGYADRSADRLWEHDTMTVTFSTTKAIAALIVAIFVSRQQLHYDDLVIKYWPEFGQHGKQNVTIQWILEHKVGLLRFEKEIELEKANDHVYISHLIEESKPLWPPGTQCAYHAITQGWLIDQILRRVDTKKRGIGQFYREEIQPLMKDRDFYIGLPRLLHYRMAYIAQSTNIEFMKACLLSKRYYLFAWNAILSGENLMNIACNYPTWMSVMAPKMPYNNPKVREVENVAALGIGTARGLAAVASAIIKNNLISEEVWELLSKPTEYVFDRTIKSYVLRGHGFFYDRHPTRKDAFLLTHPGHGMQKITIDPITKTTIAFIRNLIRWDEASFQAIDRITYQLMDKIDRQHIN
uniref:Beta-lactamase-related domain-containing protein n=1 Tax=Parascaris univalens TaxID=6257 RepID=A0A915A7Y9_PARUN